MDAFVSDPLQWMGAAVSVAASPEWNGVILCLVFSAPPGTHGAPLFGYVTWRAAGYRPESD